MVTNTMNLIAEVRSWIPSGAAALLASQLGGLLNEASFVNSPYNWTVYFNPDNATTIRARRYASTPFAMNPRLDPSDASWRFERKTASAFRKSYSLVAKVSDPGYTLNGIQKQFGDPIGGVSYTRRHFVESDQEQAPRVTIDTMSQFVSMGSDFKGSALGSLPYSVAELKINPKLLGTGLARVVQRAFRGVGGRSAMSKRSYLASLTKDQSC